MENITQNLRLNSRSPGMPLEGAMSNKWAELTGKGVDAPPPSGELPVQQNADAAVTTTDDNDKHKRRLSRIDETKVPGRV